MPTDLNQTGGAGRGKPRWRLGRAGVVAALALAAVAFSAPGAAAWPRRKDNQEKQDRAQNRKQARPGGQARQAQQQRKAEQRQARQQMRDDAHQHPAQFFERLRDLPPDEQERVLANDQRFHQLPPERQQQIRENLRRWNQLTPEQRAAMGRDEEFIRNLPPEKRADLRAMTSSPEWQGLPAERRRAIIGAFRQMRTLSPADRQAFLDSADTQKSFSTEERAFLTRLDGLLR